MGKNDVPDGWEKYSRYGSRIPNTPFVAFKVPLSENLQGRCEYLPRATTDQALEHRWTLDTLGKPFPDLGLVIDLTATDRYYNPRSMKARHVKIKTQGHVVPDQNVIKRFFDEVDKALDLDEDTIIGVHCTHGINRTGYLICRYLIEKLNWDLGSGKGYSRIWSLSRTCYRESELPAKFETFETKPSGHK